VPSSESSPPPGSQASLGTHTNSTDLGTKTNTTVAGMQTMFMSYIFVTALPHLWYKLRLISKVSNDKLNYLIYILTFSLTCELKPFLINEL
jgi:hypothetical protein